MLLMTLVITRGRHRGSYGLTAKGINNLLYTLLRTPVTSSGAPLVTLAKIGYSKSKDQ